MSKWDKANYATYLGNFLQGRALEVYVRMPLEEIGNYDKLKNALLRHFEMTEDGFRRRFHSTRMTKGDTASQFMCKLSDSFDRWVKLASVEETYQGLREFMIVQQFIFGCPKEISTHIREKALHGKNEVVKHADLYLDAHRTSASFTDKTQRSAKPMGNQSYQKSSIDQASVKPGGTTPANSNERGTSSGIKPRSQVKCYVSSTI